MTTKDEIATAREWLKRQRTALQRGNLEASLHQFLNLVTPGWDAPPSGVAADNRRGVLAAIVSDDVIAHKFAICNLVILEHAPSGRTTTVHMEGTNPAMARQVLAGLTRLEQLAAPG